MIPIKLSFQGFANYENEENIDFDLLSDSKLFGIFGNTGSGKSSIIDAISFALYGRISRLSGTEKRSFINTKTEKGYVKFVFGVRKGKEIEQYIVHRDFRLKYSKKGEVAPEIKSKLYDNENNIIAENKTLDDMIVSIIGIKYSDYLKVVSLPQGKFNEVLSATPSIRMELFRDIFDMDKYSNVGIKINKDFTKKYGEVKNLRSIVESKIKDILAIDNEIDIYKYDDYINEINSIEKQEKEKYNELLKKQPLLEKEKQKLDNDYKKYENIAVAFMDRDKNIVQLEKIKTEQEEHKNLLPHREFSEKANKISPTYNRVVELKNKIKNNQNEYEKNKRKFYTVSQNIKLYENIEQEKQEILKRNEKLNYDLSLAKELEQEAKNLNYRQKKEYYINQINKSTKNNITYNNQKQSLTKIYDETKSRLEQNTKEIEIKADEVEVLEKRDVLFKFLPDLDKGVCPLCGSTEHPNKVENVLQGEVDKLKTEIISLEKEKKSINNNFGIRLSECGIIDIEYFDEQVYANAIIKIEKNISSENTNIDKFTNELEMLEKNALKLKEKINKVTSGVKITAFSKNIDDEIKSNTIFITNKENDYKKIHLQKENLDKMLNANVELTKSFTESLEKEENELNKLLSENSMDYDEFTSNYTNVMTEKEINLLDKKLNDISTEIKVISSKIEQSTVIIGDSSRENINSLLAETKQKIEVKKQQINELNQEIGSIEKTCQSIKNSKDTIQSDYNNYKNEYDEFKKYEVLNNIVGRNNFANYLVSLRRKKVMYFTNIELEKLTKGKYKLEFNSKDEFEVVERSNGEETKRKVDTLSGGETFIFSLCLSLALSKELQTNKSKAEFYFIDEGFGTLDEERIREVYEVLSKLSDSMTIGLISHTDAMKQLMQRKIVVKDSLELKKSESKITII